MPVFAEAILKMFIPKTFDNETGETISYNECYFLCEDKEGNPSVMTLNTKLDLSKYIDMHGVVELSLNPKGGKTKLVSFTPRTRSRD